MKEENSLKLEMLRISNKDLAIQVYDLKDQISYIKAALSSTIQARDSYSSQLKESNKKISKLNRRAQEAERWVGIAMRAGLDRISRLNSQLQMTEAMNKYLKTKARLPIGRRFLFQDGQDKLDLQVRNLSNEALRSLVQTVMDELLWRSLNR